jgi:surface antigen
MRTLGNPMKRLFRRALSALAVALGAVAATATAAGSGVGAVVRGGPMVDFRDADVDLLLEAVQTALNAPGEPQPVEWRNAASGAGGTLLVLGTAQHKDFAECRRVQATLFSRRTQGNPAVWTVCKDPKDPRGRWALVSAE